MNLPFRDSTTRHEMNLIANYELGGEWLCPICGRRLVIQFHPYKKIVLVEGDQAAIHTGGKGGLKMSMGLIENDPNLKPFEDFFNDAATE